jgi:hypothetical protein
LAFWLSSAGSFTSGRLIHFEGVAGGEIRATPSLRSGCEFALLKGIEAQPHQVADCSRFTSETVRKPVFIEPTVHIIVDRNQFLMSQFSLWRQWQNHVTTPKKQYLLPIVRSEAARQVKVEIFCKTASTISCPTEKFD